MISVGQSFNASNNLNWQKCTIQDIKWEAEEDIPGNLLGFLIGTNLAPIANAIGGPNINPLASTPAIFPSILHHLQKITDNFAINSYVLRQEIYLQRHRYLSLCTSQQTNQWYHEMPWYQEVK